MAGYSSKKMGKEVGQAAVYAEPHNMAGKKVTVNDSLDQGTFRPDPNTLAANKTVPGGSIPARRVSLGDRIREPKTDGIDMRGYGAAERGIKSRGPMA
jgi:hypothetical protein